jgi:hypothetical protein
MATHFCVGDFLDLFVEFARQSDAVIYTQDGAAILTHPDQRAYLPNELQNQVFLAKTERISMPLSHRSNKHAPDPRR